MRCTTGMRSRRLRQFATLLTIALTLFGTQRSLAVPLTWDNGGGNQLWSTGTNWNPDQGGAPVAADTVTFNDTASSGTQGTVTNIVDGNITIGSLTYLNDNATGSGVPPAKFHTTQINSGNTLTVNGAMTIGQNALIGTTVTIRGSVNGTGTLAINNAATNFVMDPGINFFSPADTIILDMTNLGTFTANVNNFEVGQFGGGPKTLTLAGSNTITANEFAIGRNGWNQAGTANLGQTNILNADLVSVNSQLNAGSSAAQSSTGTLQFRAGLAGVTNPTVQIRNKAGTGRANLSAGADGHTSGINSGIVNLNGGTVDALINNLRLGLGSSGGTAQARAGNGSLLFNAGTIDATNIYLGQAATQAAVGTVSGAITLAGTGSLLADNVFMTVRNTGTAGAASASITMSNSAVLRATNIDRGATAGTGAATVNFTWNGGTIGNKLGTDLLVSAGVPISLLTTTAKTFDVEAGQTATINSVLSGAGTGALTKTGGGTLLLNGTNTYAAATNVNGGVLGGTGSISGAVNVNSGGAIGPGASPGLFTVGSVDFNSGSELQIEIGGTTAGVDYDQLDVTGAAQLGGDLVVTLLNFNPTEDDVFTILTAGSLTGTFDNAPNSGDTISTNAGRFIVQYLGDSVVLSDFTAVPEPTSLVLVGLGAVALGWRVRRQKGTSK